MANTIADNMHAALGGTTDLYRSNIDLLNASLGGDIQKYGFGYAIIKNWGQPGDTVVEAARRHYGALPGESLSDAQNRYWAQQASLYPPRTNITDDPQGLRSTAGTGLGSAPHWITGRFPTDVTYSNITGQVGPLANLTTAARLTWTTTAGSDRGWHISGNAGQATNVGYFGWPVVPGQAVSASAWFRGTWAGTVPSGWWSYSFYDSANNRIGIQNLGTPYVLTKGVWVRASFSAIVPANATFLECYFAIVTTGNPLTTIGDTLDGTGLLCENNAPKSAVDGVSVAPYFDGSTTNAVWNGTAGASTSTTANGTAGYSSNPTIYPPRTNISTDPQGLRNDGVQAGVGPHWLNYRFPTDETYSNITGIVGPIASLTTACRITWKTVNGNTRGVHISGNPDTVTANTYQLWPVAPGQTATISAWFKGTWAGSVPQGGFQSAFFDNANNVVGSKVVAAVAGITNGQWIRFSQSLTVPANAVWLGSAFIMVGTVTIGDTLDGTGLLCENNAPANAIGGGIAPYFDGSSQNAYWTGATQNSSSITPDGTAGYYTNITNLIRDPTCTTSSTYWNSTQGQVLGSVDLTTARPGSLTMNSFKAFMNAGPIAFSICPPVTTTLPLIPCVPGQTFTASCWVKTDAAGQNAKISIRWRDSTNTSQVAIDNFTIVNLTANVWVRLSATFTVNAAVVGSGYIQPGVIISSFPIGNNAWMDDYMITADSIVWDYKDGGYPGWTWAGVANQSQSSGTTIT